jgi:hypothetical protein
MASPMNANPNSSNSENTNRPSRRGRGPSERGRQIIDMRNAGAKQIVIANRIGVSVDAVKQVLRRHRRRASVIRTPEDANVSFSAEQEGLD